MKICFIGGGNMVAAMIAGMTSHGYGQDIIVFDRNDYKCLNLSIKYNIEISASLLDAVKLADILILAIKPQNMPELIKNIREVVTSRQVIVTVAAGIQTNAYERLF